MSKQETFEICESSQCFSGLVIAWMLRFTLLPFRIAHRWLERSDCRTGCSDCVLFVFVFQHPNGCRGERNSCLPMDRRKENAERVACGGFADLRLFRRGHRTWRHLFELYNSLSVDCIFCCSPSRHKNPVLHRRSNLKSRADAIPFELRLPVGHTRRSLNRQRSKHN